MSVPKYCPNCAKELAHDAPWFFKTNTGYELECPSCWWAGGIYSREELEELLEKGELP